MASAPSIASDISTAIVNIVRHKISTLKYKSPHIAMIAWQVHQANKVNDISTRHTITIPRHRALP